MDYEQRFSSIRSFYEDMLETFMVDKGILEKTLEFAPGEWLLSSYIATDMWVYSYLLILVFTIQCLGKRVCAKLT